MSNVIEMQTSNFLVFERARSAIMRGEFVELFGTFWSVYSATSERGAMKILLIEVKPIVLPS